MRIGYFGVKGYNNFKISEWKGDIQKPEIVNGDNIDKHPERKHLDVRNPA